PEVPPEWQGKSLEELRTLVAEKESELESCRKRRNKAQVEHASLQSYYDVTKDQIRELDMKIDKIDLEIQNTEDDNATELKLYKQKSKYLQYCHDHKVKTTLENDDSREQNYNANQERQMDELEATKAEKMAESSEIEHRHIEEIKKMQADIEQEISDVRQNLNLDIARFEESCDIHHTQLKEELEGRRKAELDIVTSRKESHLQDLMQCHEKTCKEMKEYFEGIEREQEVEMECLQAEIRKLKKAAKRHSETKERLEASNRDHGKELQDCLQQVSMTIVCRL
ncbi:hypothetical protein ACHAW6_013675, partial [Cyclotella cf. meneghiniana]